MQGELERARRRRILTTLGEVVERGLADAMSGDWRYIDESNPDAGVTNGRAIMSTRAYRELLDETPDVELGGAHD